MFTRISDNCTYQVLYTKSILLLDDLQPKKCKTTISANDYFQIKRNIAELAGWPKNSFIKIFFKKLLLFTDGVIFFFHKLLRIARKNCAGQRGSLNSKKCPPRQRVLFIPKGVSSLEQRRRDVTLVQKCYKISKKITALVVTNVQKDYINVF